MSSAARGSLMMTLQNQIARVGAVLAARLEKETRGA
jgi:hypothetical protein